MLLIIDKGMVDSFQGVDNTKIYNFNTLKEGLIDIANLFNLSDKIGYMAVYGTVEFDIAYANMINGNDLDFKSLYHIIYDLYREINVCIAVDFDNHGEYMIEALTKIIQQKYEYNATYVYDDEDIPALKDISQEFGIGGLYNTDCDGGRFFNLLTEEERKIIDIENDLITNANK